MACFIYCMILFCLSNTSFYKRGVLHSIASPFLLLFSFHVLTILVLILLDMNQCVSSLIFFNYRHAFH